MSGTATVVVLEGPSATVRVLEPDEVTVVAVQDRSATVVATAEIGPRGPAGTPASSLITRTASGALSGHRVVVPTADGTVVYASSADPTHRPLPFGFTTQAAADGDPVNVLMFGRLVEPSWSWTPGAALYLGTNGQLTHTEPTSPNFLVQVAVAESATAIYFDPRQPVQR